MRKMRNRTKAYLIYAVCVVTLHFLVFYTDGGAVGLMGLLPLIIYLTIRSDEGKKNLRESFKIKKGKLFHEVTAFCFLISVGIAVYKIEDLKPFLNAYTDGWVLFFMCIGFLSAGLPTIFDQEVIISDEQD
jgi:hypothetical protein